MPQRQRAAPKESILGDLQAQKEAKEAQEMANGMVNDDEIVLLPVSWR